MLCSSLEVSATDERPQFYVKYLTEKKASLKPLTENYIKLKSSKQKTNVKIIVLFVLVIKNMSGRCSLNTTLEEDRGLLQLLITLL